MNKLNQIKTILDNSDREKPLSIESIISLLTSFDVQQKDERGYTPLMLWIRYRKLDSFQNIPKELFYDGWQLSKNKNEYTPLMLWIKHHRQDIPTEMEYTDWYLDTTIHGDTPLMLWVRYRNNTGQSIPKKLLLNSKINSLNIFNESALRLWIDYNHGMNIPQELFYEGWQTDNETKKSDKTIQQAWISSWLSSRETYPIPNVLKYPGWERVHNEDGESLFMWWIVYRSDQDIPSELYYPGCETERMPSEYNETPLMLWIVYNSRDIPSELYYPGCETDRDEKGETPLMLWLQYRAEQVVIPKRLYYPGWENDITKLKFKPNANFHVEDIEFCE